MNANFQSQELCKSSKDVQGRTKERDTCKDDGFLQDMSDAFEYLFARVFLKCILLSSCYFVLVLSLVCQHGS